MRAGGAHLLVSRVGLAVEQIVLYRVVEQHRVLRDDACDRLEPEPTTQQSAAAPPARLLTVRTLPSLSCGTSPAPVGTRTRAGGAGPCDC